MSPLCRQTAADLSLLCPHNDRCPCHSARTRCRLQAIQVSERLLAGQAARHSAGRCHYGGHDDKYKEVCKVTPALPLQAANNLSLKGFNQGIYPKTKLVYAASLAGDHAKACFWKIHLSLYSNPSRAQHSCLRRTVPESCCTRKMVSSAPHKHATQTCYTDTVPATSPDMLPACSQCGIYTQPAASAGANNKPSETRSGCAALGGRRRWHLVRLGSDAAVELLYLAGVQAGQELRQCQRLARVEVCRTKNCLQLRAQ